LNRHVGELKGHTAVSRLPNQQGAIASIFFAKLMNMRSAIVHLPPFIEHLTGGLETRFLLLRPTVCPEI
jgi:hypothetical protein